MEGWVTPGRVKVPHLKTVWNPSTMSWSIEQSTPNPHDYGTLATSSQAYQNLTGGIPSGYNQYSGCPVGHVMGPDGVCRPVTGFTGIPDNEISLPYIPSPDDPTDPTPDPFTPTNQYARGEGRSREPQTDPYKEYMAGSGHITGNDYSGLPGGMNNWTDEAFYDWGLDKGYITESGIGGPMQSKLKFGIFAFPSQLMNDKKFQWWKDSAIERGLIDEALITSGRGGTGNRTVPSYKLLKKRGEGEGFGGGGLIDIITDKPIENTAESTWNNVLKDTFDPSNIDDSTMLQKRITQEDAYKTRPGMEITSNLQNLTDSDLYDKGYVTSPRTNLKQHLEKFGQLKVGVSVTPRPTKGILPRPGLSEKHLKNRQDNWDRLYAATHNVDGSPKSATQIGIEQSEATDITERFDPLLGEWVKDSPGLAAEAKRRADAKKLLDQQQDDLKIKPKIKPKDMFNIGTDAGNAAYNMSTAQTGQYIGASVYKSPDKSSNVGGHYQQNGKFVQSDGTVTAGGSMSDSIYAMVNGTAVDSVLDRTLKNNNSYKVMKKEADKMKKAGKITQDEYDKVITYKTKKDYQADEKNLTIHENGQVVGGGTTGQSLGPAGSGSAGTSGGNQDKGNTGSGSKKDKIICTEMYRQTNLNDWKEAMKLWYLFQKKHLTPTHQVGYHFLFKPFVKGMKKSKILTAIGSHFAKQRTKDIKHIMFGTKFSLLGRIYRIIFEPICYVTGLLLTYKEKLAWQ